MRHIRPEKHHSQSYAGPLLWTFLAILLVSRWSRIGPGEGSITNITISMYAIVSLPLFVAATAITVIRTFFPDFRLSIPVAALAGLSALFLCYMGLHILKTDRVHLLLIVVGVNTCIPWILHLTHAAPLDQLRTSCLHILIAWLGLTITGCFPWDMFRFVPSSL